MGWFNDDSDEAQAYNQVVNAPHKAELSHELIAAAASYEAAKAAGLAGAFIDRIVETKGLDFLDQEKAKRQARDQVHESYDRNN
ncbi:hypothetical protein PTI98_005148 [Pleurotus ostreatus]|nr:hypothetical protein PTI98_005148 [Pleurotus ostreatus]